MRTDIGDLLGENSEFEQPIEQSPLSALVKPTNVALDVLIDPETLLPFLEATRNAPFGAIDALAVSQGYAAAVWVYRQAALQGDYKTTKALELWIRWATEVNNRPPPDTNEKITNPLSKNFTITARS